MNKEEVGKVIVEELDNTVSSFKRKLQTVDNVVETGSFITSTYSAVDVATNILAKLPDDDFEVIAGGKLSDLTVIPAVHKYEIYFSSIGSIKIGTIPDLKGKNIEIAIRIIPDIKDESRGK